ncbi:beta-1,3-galactosyltransferase 1-like [Plakobranchus ocellatus]|uniref:Hexosyltransferase n=1 Tax=Plakobranchus ocellatus TaxID=259542 RepID=A0AAV4DCD5_9GAST|nr:beta-1,3-galactosyltransferase 1-like [Plakobranchus ocellatus]
MNQLRKFKFCAEVTVLFLLAAAAIQILFLLSSGANSVVQVPQSYVVATEISNLAEESLAKAEKLSEPHAKVNFEIDVLKNLTEPYYNILIDKGFHVDRTYFTLAKEKISTIPENFILSGSNICEKDIPSILFIIPSVAKSDAAKERLDIRKTWASKFYDTKWRQSSSTRLAFFFGGSGLKPEDLQALKNESATFGDIMVADFVDSYGNLSLKMATTITWVARNCPSIKAAIKVDMDTFVNVNLLLSLIEKVPVNTKPSYVFGHQHYFLHPAVVRSGSWKVPQTVYPFDKFPRYIYGHSYVLSKLALKQIAESFPYFPIVPNEDAFVTGIMAVTLNITQYYHKSFATLLEKRTFCKMTNNFYVTTLVKKEDRGKLWNYFKTGKCIDEEL